MNKTKGTQLLVDLKGLDKAVCLDADRWINVFLNISEILNLQVISKYVHTFEPPNDSGFTAYILLDASHFSIHTYADLGKAAIDLFACKVSDLEIAFNVIKEHFGISEKHIAMKNQLSRFSD